MEINSEQKNNIKLIYIAVFIVILMTIIFVVILIIIKSATELKLKTTQRSSQNITQITPTNNPVLKKSRARTGAIGEQPTEEEILISQQEINLLNNLPINTSQFSITMDYRNQKYIVNIKEPKAENKIYFDRWLKTNYSLITLEQFIIR